MSTRAKQLVLTGSAVAVLVAFLWRAQPDPPPRPSSRPVVPVSSVAPSAPVSAPLSPGVGVGRNLVTHAVDVGRLDGFPPDAEPGDLFDIWVAWNPPVVKGPNIQLLLKEVDLEKVAPPVTPEGPHVAFLLMSRAEARQLLYATRYGVLSVTQPAGATTAP